MKTPEEMKAAVLAYCEKVVPTCGSAPYRLSTDVIIDGMATQLVKRWRLWLFGTSLALSSEMSAEVSAFAYRILGLETRDAIAEMQALKSLEYRSPSWGNLGPEMEIQALKDELQAERERAAKLVDDYWKFDSDQQPLSSWHDKQALLNAIEAYKTTETP